MDNTTILKHFAGYDLWANRRVVERLEQVPELLDAPVRSSFPSLRLTLLHIRDAEHSWLKRIRGEEYSWPAEPSQDPKTVIRHSEALHDHVMSLTESDLVREATYQDLRGNTHRQPVWQMLMHCFNHGTQHRGQLITMMRQLGIEHIPANDMVVYMRQQQALL